MRELLLVRHGYPSFAHGEGDPYDRDAEYEDRRPDDWCFREAWEWCRSEVQCRARFFSTHAEEALREIFGDLSTRRASGNKPVVCEVEPEDADFAIWRARTARSTKEFGAVLKSPVRHLGPRRQGWR